MDLKKILVPIDFSSCSKIQLAKKTKAELLLLHAFQIPVAHGELGAQTVIMGLATDIEKDIEEDFENLKNEIPELNEVNYKSNIKHAYPIDAILSAVLTEKIDLIVMGTHGASGIDEIIMGTNAYSVIKDLRCPVLVIPKNGNLKNVNRIAYASDYKHLEDTSILNPMINIAALYDAEIDILHLSDKKEMNSEEAEEAERIENQLKDVIHSYHFKSAEDIEQSLNQHIAERQIDILVMVPRKHKFFEKHWTKKMAFHGKTPLLALPS